MKAWIGAAALVGTMASGQAMADGNQLLGQCQAALRTMDGVDKANPGFNVGYCMGQVTGVMDMLSVHSQEILVRYRPCTPEGGIPYGQGIRIVVQFLKENPRLLQLEASTLINMALKDAYPCKN